MSFALGSGQTLAFQAGTANAIIYSVSGLDVPTTGTPGTPKQFAVGTLTTTSSTAVLSPTGPVVVTDIDLANTTGNAVTLMVARGAVTTFGATIPANGSMHYGGGRWIVYDAAGTPQIKSVGPTGTVYAVYNKDGTIQASPSVGGAKLWRPAITGDVGIATGGNTSHLTSIQGLPILTGPPPPGTSLVANGPTGMQVLQWQPVTVTGATGPSFLIQEPIYNIVSFGADPSGVNDSTTAIQNAITAAGVNGTVYAPTGAYKISSLVTIGTPTAPITFYGDGGGHPPNHQPNTTFLCTTATSGLLLNGSGSRYQGFSVDGTATALNPLQRGVPPTSFTGFGSPAQGAGTNSFFIDIWANNNGIGSLYGDTNTIPAANITILQAQHDRWYACGTQGGPISTAASVGTIQDQKVGSNTSGTNNMFIGSAASDIQFLSYYDRTPAGLGVYINGSLQPTNGVDGNYVSHINFYEGLWDPPGTNSGNVSPDTRIQLTWCHDISIRSYVDGNGTKVGAVEVDPSCYSIDLRRVRWQGTSGVSNFPCLVIGSTRTGTTGATGWNYQSSTNPCTIWLDYGWFWKGSSAIYFAAAPTNNTNAPIIYATSTWIDKGITGSSGPFGIAPGLTMSGVPITDPNPLVKGRRLYQQGASLSAGWTSTGGVTYGLNANNETEFTGTLTVGAGNSGTAVFTLPAGYTPTNDVYVPLAAGSTSTAYAKIQSYANGATVYIYYTGTPGSIYLDGVVFAAQPLS